MHYTEFVRVGSEFLPDRRGGDSGIMATGSTGANSAVAFLIVTALLESLFAADPHCLSGSDSGRVFGMVC